MFLGKPTQRLDQVIDIVLVLPATQSGDPVLNMFLVQQTNPMFGSSSWHFSGPINQPTLSYDPVPGIVLVNQPNQRFDPVLGIILVYQPTYSLDQVLGTISIKMKNMRQ